MRRVGIYAGTFDPVHSGHISFALQAKKIAKLDKIYFLPERRPRHKDGVEHFAHRLAMIKRAIRPHADFETLDFEDANFTVKRTLPKLRRLEPDSRLVFLFGSDVVEHVPSWKNASRLLESSELVVGVRSDHQKTEFQQMIGAWPIPPLRTIIIESYAPDVSSSKIREALRRQASSQGLLASVAEYSRRYWLYVNMGNKKLIDKHKPYH